MDHTREIVIREELLDRRDRYGKIGILIDDAPDANSRVARELYGTERLPEWWLQARSTECGSYVLGVFVEIFEQPNVRRVHGIALIDRFLPIHEERERPVAWDALRPGLLEEERKICEEMERAVRKLISMARSGTKEGLFWYELITSYPHVPLELGFEAKTREPLPWQTRSIEVLFQLRRELPSALRAYGPEKYAPASGKGGPLNVTSYDRIGEANWKARAWRATIEGLAKVLVEANDSTPVILFTGAGASLAQGAYGAGMPPTWWLLEETCRALVHDKRENGTPAGKLRQRYGGAPPRAGHDCCHRRQPERTVDQIPFPEQGDVAPIDWLIDYLLDDEAHRASDLQCRLETIFSRHWNRKSIRSARRFYEYFRSHLERFDHGFSYHHWLLAQMPWTRVITTNFDSFHERAAFAAASEFEAEPEARQGRLALGCVFPNILGGRSDEEFSEFAKSFRLFKPYGSLLLPAELALSVEQLATFKDRLSLALRGLEHAQRGWLVVIGHAMNDKYISDALTALDGGQQNFQKRFELLWVDPMAYRRCAPISRGDGTYRSTWEEWIYAKMEQREKEDAVDSIEHPSGPLPGTALEFTYDLWAEYQRALRARIGRS